MIGGNTMTRIDDKWESLGGPNSPVGDELPDHPELPTPDGMGTYRHYERGSIYWKHFELLKLPIVDVCPHAIYGEIRNFWAGLGWEASPLGWPIADEQPARETDLALYRFSDFENGVLYWQHTSHDQGSGEEQSSNVTNLTPLSPVLLRDFADLDLSAAGLAALARERIAEEVGDRAEITHLSVSAAPEYTCQAGIARNRLHLVRVVLVSTSGCIVRPVIDLTLRLEVTFDRPNRVVQGILRSWEINGIGNLIFDIGRGDIENGIKDVLDPLLGRALMSETLPDYINVLSVKTMLNGDVNVYVEPVCLIATASAKAAGLSEDHPELAVVRQFRDEYLGRLPGGRLLTDLYYWLAPQVVAEINRSQNAERIYQTLYKSYIAPAVELVQQGRTADVFSVFSTQIPQWISVLAGSESTYKVAEDLTQKLVPLAIKLLGEGQVDAFNQQALQIVGQALHPGQPSERSPTGGE
jgi:hypothetical protein